MRKNVSRIVGKMIPIRCQDFLDSMRRDGSNVWVAEKLTQAQFQARLRSIVQTGEGKVLDTRVAVGILYNDGSYYTAHKNIDDTIWILGGR